MQPHMPKQASAPHLPNRRPTALAAPLLILVFLLYAGLPALAQSPGSTSPWQFSSSLGSSYNDNRDGVATNRQDNLELTTGSRGTYQLRDGDRTELNLTIAPIARWQSNPAASTDANDTLDGTKLFGSAALDLKHQLTPSLTATAGDALRYSDDAEVPEQDTIQRNRTTSYLVHTAYVGTDAQVAPDVVVALQGSTIGIRYSDQAAAQENDSDTYAGSVTTTYQLDPELALFGQVGVSEYQGAATSGSDDVLLASYAAGFTFMFSRDLITKISGSYQTAQYQSDQPSSSMPGAQADLTFQATKPTRYHLTANYGYSDPNVAETSVQKKLALIGSVDHDLIAERLTVGTQLQYTDSQDANDQDRRADNSEQMIRMRGYGTYHLTRQWSTTLGYTFEDWTSVQRDSFQRNTLDASMLYTW
jgi:hypothetical protein